MIGEPLFSVAIITLGIDIIVRTITDDFIGTDIRPMGDPWGATVIDLGPVVIPQVTIVQFAVTVVLMAGIALFFRSRTGVAMRATAFDQEAAMAQGIGVGKIFGIAWAIGAGMAAVGGMFAAMFPRATGVSAATAFIAFRAFPAVIIGGLDSIVGAVVGGSPGRPGRGGSRHLCHRHGDRVRRDHALRPDAGGAVRPPIRAVRDTGGHQGMRPT